MLANRLRMSGRPLPSVEFVEYQDDGNALTTYTFASSTYDAGVLVIAVHGKRSGGGTYAISSVTVDGASASEVVQQDVAGASNPTVSGLYAITLASQTTGSIAVTFSVAQLRSAIGVFLLPNGFSADSTGTDARETSGTVSATVGGSGSGVYIAACTSNGGTTTWTNVTEQYDNAVVGNSFTTASAGTEVSSGSVTISATTSYSSLVAARFVA